MNNRDSLAFYKFINNIMNKKNQRELMCNITIGNITIISITRHNNHGLVLHTARQHGIPFLTYKDTPQVYNIIHKEIYKLYNI